MKKNVTYQCEICSRTYQKESSALECEKIHKLPKEVKSPVYNSKDNKCQYPESVIVLFEDKTSARYYRKG